MPPLFSQARVPSDERPSASGSVGGRNGGLAVPGLPSLAGLEAPRDRIMSARSRRMQMLPPIPECAQPECVIAEVRPHLEYLDTQHLSALATGLVQLCDVLAAIPAKPPRPGAAARPTDQPTGAPPPAAANPQPLSSWGDPANSQVANQLRGVADDGGGPPAAKAPSRSPAEALMLSRRRRSL